LGHYGYTEEAIAFFSDKKCYFQKDLAGFEEALAALRGTSGQLSQRGMATRLFDNFAEDYDRNLKALRNSGPQMIGATLGKLDLPRNGHLEFLDAGCGTGLCAPFLRPFASQINGCDVSIPMLEQCKQKKLYGHLTRTDLGVLSTYPDKKFDVVVSGAVLVYFGDLLPVVQNFKEVLKTGGCLSLRLRIVPKMNRPKAMNCARQGGTPMG
jgi:predicted TPR repeat methyltransferase